MRGISWQNTVTVKCSNKNFETFANECKKKNIILKSITSDKDGYAFCLSFDDFKKIRGIVRTSRARLSIQKKDGAGYFVRIHRRRYGFYIGALMAVIIFVYLTSCIWVVDVDGNETTSDEEIIKVVNKYGIGVGKTRFGKKISDIKNKSLIELDNLSWLWVTIDGTRALVEVREKGEREDIVDKTIPHNLVASYGGEIVDMGVRQGKKMVQRGDIVSKGDLLVSGAVETVYKGNRYVHSYGSVIARTWRSYEGEYSCTDVLKTKTGNEKKRYSIQTPKSKLKLYIKDDIPYKKYVLEIDKKPIKIFGNFYLPFVFTTEKFCEIIEKNITIDEDVAIERAVNYLTSRIEAQRDKNAITLKRTYSYYKLPNGNISVSVTLESKENIARSVEIEFENSGEYTVGENN